MRMRETDTHWRGDCEDGFRERENLSGSRADSALSGAEGQVQSQEHETVTAVPEVQSPAWGSKKGDAT